MSGLFGANSSGKTSILQFPLLMRQTVESSDRKLVLDFGGDEASLVALGSFKDLVYGHDSERRLHGRLDWRATAELKVPRPRAPSSPAPRPQPLL